MHTQLTSPLVWVLTDDRPGNFNQALGVAEALDIPYVQKEICYTGLACIPNWLLGNTLLGVDESSRQRLVAPWPDVVIAAGRRSAPVARAIKRRSGGKAKLVQLMWPDCSIQDFDLIVLPEHDRRGVHDKYVYTLGSPHRGSAQRLVEAREHFADRLASLKGTKIAVLVGGSTKSRPFTVQHAETLGREVSILAKKLSGMLMMTTSRRTSVHAGDALNAHIEVPYMLYRYGDDGENPYMGYLAYADVVVVTGESMSMCSEACMTGKPVYIFAPDGFVGAKHARLHAALYDKGFAKPLGDSTEIWEYAPLNEASRVAGVIRERLLSVVS